MVKTLVTDINGSIHDQEIDADTIRGDIFCLCMLYICFVQKLLSEHIQTGKGSIWILKKMTALQIACLKLRNIGQEDRGYVVM